MIVALARNLLIALWRYAKDGVTGFARAPPRTRECRFKCAHFAEDTIADLFM